MSVGIEWTVSICRFIKWIKLDKILRFIIVSLEIKSEIEMSEIEREVETMRRHKRVQNVW